MQIESREISEAGKVENTFHPGMVREITVEDLKNCKHWIVRYHVGGLKQFAKDINVSYDTIRRVLSGEIKNSPYVVEKSLKRAIELASTMSQRFDLLKNTPKH